MSHNALINGASHSISAGKSLINGAGYKISAGKTLINGTSKNIGFALPLKWRWNDTLSWPFTESEQTIDITFSEKFIIDVNTDIPYDERLDYSYDDLYTIRFIRTLHRTSGTYSSCMYYVTKHNMGTPIVYFFEDSNYPNTWQYKNGTGRNIQYPYLTDEWFINYLKANATPIYD